MDEKAVVKMTGDRAIVKMTGGDQTTLFVNISGIQIKSSANNVTKEEHDPR